MSALSLLLALSPRVVRASECEEEAGAEQEGGEAEEVDGQGEHVEDVVLREGEIFFWRVQKLGKARLPCPFGVFPSFSTALQKETLEEEIPWLNVNNKATVFFSELPFLTFSPLKEQFECFDRQTSTWIARFSATK